MVDGDVITAINGQSVIPPLHPNELLRNQIGKQVLFTYHHKGKTEPLDAIVKPISMNQDHDLRYSRMGVHAPPEGGAGQQRQDRLRPSARDGRGRHPPVGRRVHADL